MVTVGVPFGVPLKAWDKDLGAGGLFGRRSKDRGAMRQEGGKTSKGWQWSSCLGQLLGPADRAGTFTCSLHQLPSPGTKVCFRDVLKYEQSELLGHQEKPEVGRGDTPWCVLETLRCTVRRPSAEVGWCGCGAGPKECCTEIFQQS